MCCQEAWAAELEALYVRVAPRFRSAAVRLPRRDLGVVLDVAGAVAAVALVALLVGLPPAAQVVNAASRSPGRASGPGPRPPPGGRRPRAGG